jgi:hypothetical protein
MSGIVRPLLIGVIAVAAFVVVLEPPNSGPATGPAQTGLLLISSSPGAPQKQEPPIDQSAVENAFSAASNLDPSPSPRYLPKEVWRVPDIYRFEEWFQTEPVDAQWAGTAEARLFDVLRSSAAAYRSMEVECRTRICRVELVFEPNAGVRGTMFISFLESQERLNGLKGRLDTERGLALYYLHSDGSAKVHTADEACGSHLEGGACVSDRSLLRP